MPLAPLGPKHALVHVHTCLEIERLALSSSSSTRRFTGHHMHVGQQECSRALGKLEPGRVSCLCSLSVYWGPGGVCATPHTNTTHKPRTACAVSSPALLCAGILVQEIVKPDIFWYTAPTQIELPFGIVGLLAFEVRAAGRRVVGGGHTAQTKSTAACSVGQ